MKFLVNMILLFCSLLVAAQVAPAERKPQKRYVIRTPEIPEPGNTIITTTTVTKTVVVKEKQTNNPTKKPSTPPQKEPTPPPPQKTTKVIAIKESNDTVFHYYTNKKISVKITPWVNSERKILFYDLYGNLTYSMDNVKHSYTIFTDLSFHANGAVNVAKTSTNPGASMYWYTESITFNTTNEPETRQSEKHPMDHIELPNIELWSKQKHQWIKQETVGCQPVPTHER